MDNGVILTLRYVTSAIFSFLILCISDLHLYSINIPPMYGAVKTVVVSSFLRT